MTRIGPQSGVSSSLLAKLDGAMKRITTGSLEDAVLSTEKRDRFIQAARDRSNMLPDLRFLSMGSFTSEIDRISFTERVFYPAPSEGDRAEETTSPNVATNRLEAVKLVGVSELSDEALEDNLEREGFEDTLVDLIAERAGLDLEELFINGDTDSGDPFLSLTDGWLKLAEQHVDEADFDATEPEEMFQAMLRALPQRYLSSWPRNSWRFYTTFQIEDDYRDILRNRGTDLGDAAQTQFARVAFKGIPVVEVANMPEGTTLLSQPGNQVWGMYRDIRVERDRLPRHGRTDFVTTMRGDCHYEDQDGAVVATGYEGPNGDNGDG